MRLFNSKKVKDAAKELKIEDRGKIKTAKKYDAILKCMVKVIYRCKNCGERLRVFIKDENAGRWCWRCKGFIKDTLKKRFDLTVLN